MFSRLVTVASGAGILVLSAVPFIHAHQKDATVPTEHAMDNNIIHQNYHNNLDPKYSKSIHKCQQIITKFKEYSGSPGVSVCVSVNGHKVWAEGFGYADLENLTPCHPDTVMRIASISKPFTSLLCAQLIESGKLNLQDDVRQHVPEFPNKKIDGETVTILVKHLLSHTSGIRHYKRKMESDLAIEKHKEDTRKDKRKNRDKDFKNKKIKKNEKDIKEKKSKMDKKEASVYSNDKSDKDAKNKESKKDKDYVKAVKEKKKSSKEIKDKSDKKKDDISKTDLTVEKYATDYKKIFQEKKHKDIDEKLKNDKNNEDDDNHFKEKKSKKANQHDKYLNENFNKSQTDENFKNKSEKGNKDSKEKKNKNESNEKKSKKDKYKKLKTERKDEDSKKFKNKDKGSKDKKDKKKHKDLQEKNDDENSKHKKKDKKESKEKKDKNESNEEKSKKDKYKKLKAERNDEDSKEFKNKDKGSKDKKDKKKHKDLQEKNDNENSKYKKKDKKESKEKKSKKDKELKKKSKKDKKHDKNSNFSSLSKQESEYDLEEYYLKDNFASSLDSISLFKNDDLFFKPGSSYLYSTHAFTLLALVLERASQTIFTDMMRDLLGEMHLFDTFLDENDPLIMNRARYYVRKKNKLLNSPYVDNSYKWAGGGLLSTVNDLVKFGDMLIDIYQNPSEIKSETLPIIKHETLKLLWSPVINMKSRYFGKHGGLSEGAYGLGWYCSNDIRNTGCRFVGHTGGSVGSTSVLLLAIKDKSEINSTKHTVVDTNNAEVKNVVIAILCNLQEAGSIGKTAKDIADCFLSCDS